MGLTDDEIVHYHELLEDNGISTISCSASALAASHKYLEEHDLDGKHVVVLTSGVRDGC